MIRKAVPSNASKTLILFTIAYGERYIRRFFDFCLPSLLTPGNLPSIRNESPELWVLTLTSDLPLVSQLLASPQVKSVFGDRAEGMGLNIDLASDAARMPDFSTALMSNFLCRLIDICLKKDKSFFLAPPDLIYSDNVISTCWPLHRLTGKVVAIFNGRISPSDGAPPLTADQISQVTARPHGIRELFFSNMASYWRDWTTTDPDLIPEHAATGHLVFETAAHTSVFCGNPNPTIGKFTQRDLIYFSTGVGIGAWDHAWLDSLFQEGRLLLQTNLDLCMSIEIDDRSSAAVMGLRTLTEKFGVADLDVRRAHKFSGPFAHVAFTSCRAGRAP